MVRPAACTQAVSRGGESALTYSMLLRLGSGSMTRLLLNTLAAAGCLFLPVCVWNTPVLIPLASAFSSVLV